MDTKKMRACTPLLPPPGDEVVRECLDEIEQLEDALSAARAENERLRVPIEVLTAKMSKAITDTLAGEREENQRLREENDRLREVAIKAQEALENIRIREAELDAMCEDGWDRMRASLELETEHAVLTMRRATSTKGRTR